MGSVSDAMLLAAEAGPHLPSVSDFLPPEILFEVMISLVSSL